MKKIPVKDLYQIAGGLNIEGGYPGLYLNRDNPGGGTIWANILLVLDRPLIDKILFEDLDRRMRENNYPLLENTIDEINEHQMFAIYLMLILYYKENGRRLLGKGEHESLNILIHIHQDVTSQNLIKILQDLLNTIPPSGDATINFKTDQYTFIYSKHDYKGVDILISLSQCAGLDPKLNPGDMIIPNLFIPYHIEESKVRIKDTYSIQNDLCLLKMNEILDSRFNLLATQCVNSHYQSANKTKNHQAIEWKDFKQMPILQVDALWNPTEDNQLVNLD